jgi:hypothetical protein
VWLIEPEKQFALAFSKSLASQNQPALIWPGFELRLDNGLAAPLADLFG